MSAISASAYRAMTAKPARSKYGNHRVVVDGDAFDSKLEARRFQVLLLRQKAGQIANLERQVPYTLTAGAGVVIGTYKADFTYDETDKPQHVVEDCKSKATITPLFRWKAKHMRAEHGIEIRLVERASQ